MSKAKEEPIPGLAWPPVIVPRPRPSSPLQGEGIRLTLNSLPTQHHYTMNDEDREYGFNILQEHDTLTFVVAAAVIWLMAVVF